MNNPDQKKSVYLSLLFLIIKKKTTNAAGNVFVRVA